MIHLSHNVILIFISYAKFGVWEIPEYHAVLIFIRWIIRNITLKWRKWIFLYTEYDISNFIFYHAIPLCDCRPFCPSRNLQNAFIFSCRFTLFSRINANSMQTCSFLEIILKPWEARIFIPSDLTSLPSGHKCELDVWWNRAWLRSYGEFTLFLIRGGKSLGRKCLSTQSLWKRALYWIPNSGQRKRDVNSTL